MKIFYKILFCVLIFCSITQTSKASTVSEFPDKIVKLIQCYPNPAITSINFELPIQNEKVFILTIYNFIGKKVDEIRISSGRTTLQLDNYFRGLYVYQLRDKQGELIESGKFQVINN